MTDKAREAIEVARLLETIGPHYTRTQMSTVCESINLLADEVEWLEEKAERLEKDYKIARTGYDFAVMRIERLEAEHRETLEVLEDVTNQATYMHREEYLDSLAISANANGLRHLAKYGRVIIDQEAGHRVIAHYPPQEDRDVN